MTLLPDLGLCLIRWLKTRINFRSSANAILFQFSTVKPASHAGLDDDSVLIPGDHIVAQQRRFVPGAIIAARSKSRQTAGAAMASRQSAILAALCTGTITAMVQFRGAHRVTSA